MILTRRGLRHSCRKMSKEAKERQHCEFTERIMLTFYSRDIKVQKQLLANTKSDFNWRQTSGETKVCSSEPSNSDFATVILLYFVTRRSSGVISMLITSSEQRRTYQCFCFWRMCVTCKDSFIVGPRSEILDKRRTYVRGTLIDLSPACPSVSLSSR